MSCSVIRRNNNKTSLLKWPRGARRFSLKKRDGGTIQDKKWIHSILLKEFKLLLIIHVTIIAIFRLKLLINSSTDKHNEKFCSYYLQLLDRLNIQERMEIETMIHEMLMNKMPKFKKDFMKFSYLKKGSKLKLFCLASQSQMIKTSWC